MLHKLYLASPLREEDRQYTNPIKEALEKLNQFYYKHDQFAAKLDSVSLKQCKFAGKTFNVYPDNVAKEIASTEISELKDMDALVACLPPTYHEFTQGVSIEIGITLAMNKPILLFIDRTRPVSNLSLLLRFYPKLHIHYMDEDIEQVISDFVNEI